MGVYVSLPLSVLLCFASESGVPSKVILTAFACLGIIIWNPCRRVTLGLLCSSNLLEGLKDAHARVVFEDIPLDIDSSQVREVSGDEGSTIDPSTSIEMNNIPR